MSAIGLSFGGRPSIISAHAEFKRSDFIFPRTQSQALRDLPWGRRAKPRKSWAELGLYATTGVAGLIAMLTVF